LAGPISKFQLSTNVLEDSIPSPTLLLLAIYPVHVLDASSRDLFHFQPNGDFGHFSKTVKDPTTEPSDVERAVPFRLHMAG
jgi:hypothetical protein